MDDRALVEQAAAGSREAFDQLIGRYQTPIINLVRALTAGSVDAEDLAQEVFVRAWRGLQSFRGDSAFGTWLHRVAVNVVHSHRGRSSRLRRLFGEAPRVDIDDPQDRIETAPDRLDLERDLVLRDAIDKALATLPDDLRLALILRDVQGLDYRAIADITQTPIGTVESRIFRARQRLKPLLAGIGDSHTAGVRR